MQLLSLVLYHRQHELLFSTWHLTFIVFIYLFIYFCLCHFPSKCQMGHKLDLLFIELILLEPCVTYFILQVVWYSQGAGKVLLLPLVYICPMPHRFNSLMAIAWYWCPVYGFPEWRPSLRRISHLHIRRPVIGDMERCSSGHCPSTMLKSKSK